MKESHGIREDTQNIPRLRTERVVFIKVGWCFYRRPTRKSSDCSWFEFRNEGETRNETVLRHLLICRRWERPDSFSATETRSAKKIVQTDYIEGLLVDGWLRNPQDGWTYRFQRDEKSWSVDPRVFVDKGRAMPDGSPALLKTRKHLRRERAEGMWKDLVRKGWEKVPAVWGADAEES